MATRLRVPFGLRDGVLVEPGSVPNGKACGCICPGCARPLVAYNQGQVRSTAYFGHRPGEDCPKAVESAIHLAGKHALLQSKRWLKPALALDYNGNMLSSGGEPGRAMSRSLREHLVEPEGRFEYRAVTAEVNVSIVVTRPLIPANPQADLFMAAEVATTPVPSVHVIRTDLRAEHNNYTDWIEICVRHLVDPWKRALMEAASMRVIEVHLDHLLTGPVTLADVFRDVIETVTYKVWIAHPGMRRDYSDEIVRIQTPASRGASADSRPITLIDERR